MSQLNQFCFTHLTDPHLSSLENAQYRQLFNKRLLGYLSWKTRRQHHHLPSILAALISDMKTIKPDHVVISGDLTHIGLDDEFDQVANWLPSIGFPEQVTIIPGNHETYIKSTWHETFAKWHDYLAADSTPADSPVEFPTLRVRHPIALIGLNSAYPSAPFLATGKLGNQQLIKLGKLLEQTKQQGLYRVVIVHHPPIPGICKWRKRLIDASGLKEILKQHGTELVLYGHTHKTEYRELPIVNGTIPLISLSSASSISDQHSRRASYAVFRVSKNQFGEWQLSKTIRQYQQEQQKFVEYPCSEFQMNT
ncbi:MAG: metallophosphoesterase [Methylococcales bacterium]